MIMHIFVMKFFWLSSDTLLGTIRTRERLSILKLISGHNVVPYIYNIYIYI
jgi:hypothetical protein